MTVDRENLIWGPVANFRTLLASAPAFRALVGATTTEDAAAHVYTPGLAAGEIAAARPYAVIDQGASREMIRSSTDGFTDAGSLLFLLEAAVAAGDQGQTAAAYEAAHKAFLTVLGEILAEMMTLSNATGHLAMTGARLVAGPARSDDDGEGDFYQTIVEIDWRTA